MQQGKNEKRHIYGLVLLFLFGGIGAQAQQITLYRDKYGLPSVEASQLEDAFYGLGYAMAQDNAERMALNYKQARGRMAEVVGKPALLMDTFLHSLGMEELAIRKAATLKGDEAIQLQRFCAGANRALAEQRASLPTWIEPFTPTDVLALAQLINAAFPLFDIAGQLMPGAGSNQFAVAPKRSATGHAILSADPHLNWSGPLLWYEFSLYTPLLAFHGITPSGLPFGVMGHTDRVAWCMTNNNPDLFDFFKVETNPENARQYNYHGEWRDFEDTTVTLRYLENGSLQSQTQRIRRTVWGPMVPLRSQAVRLSMLGSWDALSQALNMARAQNGNQLRSALRPLGFSMWNIVYADTFGNIGYQYNARVPRRDATLDWTRPVNGADPQTRWGAFWRLDDLPRVENPASGLLVNANSSPWLTPLGNEIKATGWPSYVTSYGPTTRYDRLAALLSADPKITLEEAKRYATDTQVPNALPAIQALSRALASPLDAKSKQALPILTRWNGRADLNAQGCTLYLYWLRADRRIVELARKAAQGAGWSAEETEMARKAWQKGLEAMERDHHRFDVPWRNVHLSTRGKQNFPVTGLAYFQPNDATATVAPNFGEFREGKIYCTGGSSFRMIVHLDPKEVRSWSILPYGISQNPAHHHFSDQVALFGQGQYKDTYFGLKRIRKEAFSTQALSVRP